MRLFFKKIKRYGILFLLGGVCYFLLELVFRGKSHFSMFFAGGFSVVLIRIFCSGIKGTVKRCILGGLIITTVELGFGIIFNLWFGMAVWDYSHLPYNIMGQICPQFTVIWMLLTLPVLWLGDLICGKRKKELSG